MNTTRPPRMLPAAAAATALALLAAAAPARAAESFDGCAGFISSVPASITTQGVWCLDKDLATSLSNGIAVLVNTNNVTLDCNGFKLGGLGGGPATTAIGVFVNHRLNVTVRNCNIRGFRHGIFLEGADGGGHLVEDNLLEGNTGTGIVARGANSLVRNNRVIDTGGTSDLLYVCGIETGGSVDVVGNTIAGLRGNPALTQFAYGVLGFDGSGQVVRNTIRDLAPSGGSSQGYGVLAQAGAFRLIEGNEVDGHEGFGTNIAIACLDNRPRARGNTSHGYAGGVFGCTNLGGNVHVP